MNAPSQTSSPAVPVCDDWSAPVPPWLCRLSDFHLTRASGEEVFTFLNNQLSNELKEVSQDTSQFSGYCSPKGRLYAVFLVFMRGSDYCLRATTNSAIIDRLRMFILQTRVTLDAETTLSGIGLIGADAARLLHDAALPPPTTVSGVVQHEDYSIIRSPGTCERYEIYAPDSAITALWERLAPDAAPADSGVWRLHDILAGLPNIYPQTSERFVPQMVNLDLTGALSFSKGCYPGQEVVARTHYLGKLKRRMYRFALSRPATDPAPGDTVFVPAYSSEQPSGEIVDAYALPDGTLQGLASLRIRGLEQGELHLGAPDGVVAHVQPLPYEITADTQADAGGGQ